MDEQEGKWVHHSCGMALWSVVGAQLGDNLVVHYRVGGPGGLLTFQCPECGGMLRMWWKAPPGWVSREQWREEIAEL